MKYIYERFLITLLLIILFSGISAAEFKVTSKITLNPDHIGLQLLDAKEKSTDENELCALLIVHCEIPELIFLNKKFKYKQIDIEDAYLILLKDGADKITVTEDGTLEYSEEFGFKLKSGSVYELSLEVTGAVIIPDKRYEHFLHSLESFPKEIEKGGYRLNFSYLTTGDDSGLINFEVFPEDAQVSIDDIEIERGVHRINLFRSHSYNLKVRLANKLKRKDLTLFGHNDKTNDFLNSEERYISFNGNGKELSFGTKLDSKCNGFDLDKKKIPVKLTLNGKEQVVELYRRQCRGLFEGEYNLEKVPVSYVPYQPNAPDIITSLPNIDKNIQLKIGSHPSPSVRGNKCELLRLYIKPLHKKSPHIYSRLVGGKNNETEKRAIKIVREWEFLPAESKGEAVEATVLIPINMD